MAEEKNMNQNPDEEKETVVPAEAETEKFSEKVKKFGKEKVVPAAKFVGKTVGKMATITGGVLGAVFLAGVFAGSTSDPDEDDEDEDDQDDVDEDSDDDVDQEEEEEEANGTAE